MERHKCKLCYKSFSNGRALGGHMRSHMLNLAISTKHAQQEQDQEHELPIQVSQESEFVSSSSSEEEDYDEEKGGSYGLRENPKRSIRLVDPEFSFGVDRAASIVVQDRESETESSKNPTRRRSKRSRKSLEYQYDQENKVDNVKKVQNINSDSFEPEQVSSVSDTTTEEDVAFCLMMLSRDKWKKKESQNQVQKQSHQSFQEFEEDEEVEETDESEEYIKTIKNNNNSRSSGTKGKFKCETCKKVFKSYQALGGHRASHKKLKLQAQIQEQEYFEQETVNNAGTSSLVVAEKKVHECPYCFRVFSSGQALGGHKRSHVIGVAATNVTATLNARVSSKLGNNLSFIDLNLPAPVEDEDLSAVSDAEFVNHNQIKR